MVDSKRNCVPSKDVRYELCTVPGTNPVQRFEIRNDARLNACRDDKESLRCSYYDAQFEGGYRAVAGMLDLFRYPIEAFGTKISYSDARPYDPNRKEATVADLQQVEKYAGEAIAALLDKGPDAWQKCEEALNHLVQHFKRYDNYLVSSGFEAGDGDAFDDTGYARFQKVDHQVRFLAHHLNLKVALQGLWAQQDEGFSDLRELLTTMKAKRETLKRETQMFGLEPLAGIYNDDIAALEFLVGLQEIKDTKCSCANVGDCRRKIAFLKGQISILLDSDSIPLNKTLLEEAQKFLEAKDKEVAALLTQQPCIQTRIKALQQGLKGSPKARRR